MEFFPTPGLEETNQLHNLLKLSIDWEQLKTKFISEIIEDLGEVDKEAFMSIDRHFYHLQFTPFM